MEKIQLSILLVLYLLSVLWLWRFYTRQEHQRLNELAMRDPLTGLLNRRGFEARLLAQDEEPIIGVGVFDIDDFKVVNDQHGHKVGDEVICHVARLMLNSVRQQDIVARFGGEEFVCLLKGMTASQAQKFAERLRKNIAKQKHTSAELNITVSVGLCKWQSGEGLDQVLKRADDALYEAKEGGRNQTVKANG